MNDPPREGDPGKGMPAVHFDIPYALYSSPVYADLRREALGEDIGQYSWLTADELRRFIAWLEITPKALVLDVGSGAGGPAAGGFVSLGEEVKWGS